MPRKSNHAPAPQVAPAAAHQIQHLVEHVGMINRIHTALRFSLNVEDIHAIILTSMISRSGLDFSRAFLLEYDDIHGGFRGLAALGASSREERERFEREIGEEEDRLAHMVRGLGGAEISTVDESFFSRTLRELSDHSFWITTYQKFSQQSSLFGIIQQIEILCPLDRPESYGHPSCRFLRELIKGETTQLIPQEKLRTSDLPPALTALLPADSIWATIRTKKGVRLILIVDKVFSDAPLGPSDLVHADWFVGQVALALENAEMYGDLEAAYNTLRELEQMKSNFLATISHELRTPLTAINGYLQLLLGNRIGALSPGQKEVLERIHAHSDLLTGKVNDLIEIAEIDSGRGAEASLEPVDPLGAIMNVLPRVESRRAHKGITLEPIVTDSIPRIISNANALERIFFHLIDNAIKFSHPQGRVWIEFVTEGALLAVKIVDDGIGISQNQLKRIFDSFYQVDNQLTRSYEGLGIGLTVTKKQLDYTQGRIKVESQLGKGSVFTVLYPIAHQE
jgi:signal transduction histidine kinase